MPDLQQMVGLVAVSLTLAAPWGAQAVSAPPLLVVGEVMALSAAEAAEGVVVLEPSVLTESPLTLWLLATAPVVVEVMTLVLEVLAEDPAVHLPTAQVAASLLPPALAVVTVLASWKVAGAVEVEVETEVLSCLPFPQEKPLPVALAEAQVPGGVWKLGVEEGVKLWLMAVHPAVVMGLPLVVAPALPAVVEETMALVVVV